VPRGHGDDLWRGGSRLGLQLIKHQFQLLDDARDLLRRAAELLTPQPSQLGLQPIDDAVTLGQCHTLLQHQLAQLLGSLGKGIGFEHAA
jgi:hypothetical protein